MRPGLLSTLIVAVIATSAFGGPITVNLGTASSFGLLGGTIINTGTSVVIGNVGATTTVTGFDPTGTATGTIYPYPSDPTVEAAYSDFESAFATLSNTSDTPPTDVITGSNQTTQLFNGGGVYEFSAGTITWTAASVLTFDGNNTSVFIMQIPGDMTVNGPITFDLDGGVLASNIYWIVGSPSGSFTATINPTNIPANQMVWDGSILADDFTMSGNSGSLSGTINGCVLTVAANTLANTTDVNGCSSISVATTIPEPGTGGLLALGCVLGALALHGVRSARRR